RRLRQARKTANRMTSRMPATMTAMRAPTPASGRESPTGSSGPAYQTRTAKQTSPTVVEVILMKGGSLSISGLPRNDDLDPAILRPAPGGVVAGDGLVLAAPFGPHPAAVRERTAQE